MPACGLLSGAVLLNLVGFMSATINMQDCGGIFRMDITILLSYQSPYVESMSS